ncbi:MAG TPA: DUF6364 family protein [Puia sp.]|jgi:hypothetical protein|nr:DUF6364 family protein [Puia sp.]
MKSRLNITIDEKLLTGAKRYAYRHKTSISQLVEEYFKRITGPGRKNIIDLMESLPKPRIDSGEDLKKKYYEDQKKKYGF